MRRSWASIATTLVISLAAVGCGGDDASEPDGTDPSEPSATASEPTEPDTAASDPSRSPSDTGPESPPPTDAADTPSERDLRLALLTLDDVPSGWQEEDGSDDKDDELCGFALDKLLGIDEGSLVEANVVLSADETSGPKIAEGLGLLPPGRGADVLAELRTALANCEGEEVEGIPLSVSPLELPTLADDSAAYLLRLGDRDSGWEFPLVYAIHGDLVIGVWTYDFTKAGDPVALLKQYAPIAVDKAIRGLG